MITRQSARQFSQSSQPERFQSVGQCIQVRGGELAFSPSLQRDRRHGRVVGAEGWRGNVQSHASLPGGFLELAAQAFVAGHPATDSEGFQSGLLQGADGLGGDDIRHRCLQACGQVRAGKAGGFFTLIPD